MYKTAEFQRLRDGKGDLNSTDTKKGPKILAPTNSRQNSVNDQLNYEKSVNSMKKALFMLIALVLIALVLIIQ